MCKETFSFNKGNKCYGGVVMKQFYSITNNMVVVLQYGINISSTNMHGLINAYHIRYGYKNYNIQLCFYV
jgi:hypothetical protein